MDQTELESLLSACESFSSGDGEKLMAWLHEDAVWRMIGRSEVTGIDEIRGLCRRLAEAECPRFILTYRTVAENALVIEGEASEPGETAVGFYFCDHFRLREGKVGAIDSYVVMPQTDL